MRMWPRFTWIRAKAGVAFATQGSLLRALTGLNIGGNLDSFLVFEELELPEHMASAETAPQHETGRESF